VAVDLTTPQAQIAQHFMQHKGIEVEPHDVEQLHGQPCWYFYYQLPQGELELEVAYDAGRDDWNVSVTCFPVAV
jgi:hypothetical protein